MKIQGLDRELCERRNRIVARKEHVEGVPVRLLANSEQALMTADDFEVTEYHGSLPAFADEALAMINARLPEGATDLSADDVFIHYLEAANSNFVGDRFMFLGESTLRNIAADATAGFAFMNSHRTGSLSQPTELPFGKTFAGQYQSGMGKDGKKRKRAMVGFYMLRGVKPNGDSGPTTDDLHKMILGGQVGDVSVGLMMGEAICDVCQTNISEMDCQHAPGTKRLMSDGEIEQQIERGVSGGKASYTLENARCGEVSAVYDGAVPGAGVKKVMSLRQKGKLNHREWKQARAVFGSLLDGDISMDQDLFAEVADAVESGVRAALASVDSVEPASGEPKTDTLREQAALRDALNAQARQLTEAMAKPPSEPAAKLETKGVETMAETQLPVVATDSAGDATKFAELNTELDATRAERNKLAERIAKLESDAMLTRFTAEIEGTVNGGVRWFGDHAQHKTLLVKLANAFGEQSPEVFQYIQQNRAYAAQLGESELLKEYGSTGSATEQPSALDTLTAKAKDIHAANLKLTYEQAFANATQAYPELYEQYVAEQRGGR